MVRVFREAVFVGDYGLTVNLETNLGLITLTTNFPRLNKWITINSICDLGIVLGSKIDYFGDTRFNVRDPKTFTHKLLMTIKEGIMYNQKTRNIIMQYRREHGGT